MEIKIINTNLKYLESVHQLANNSSFIVPNSKMIYYLCCTVFSEYSFVAINNNILVGYLFAMPDWENQLIWLHQMSIDKKYTNRGIGSEIFKKFESIVKTKHHFRFLRCAIRTDNIPSKKIALKFGYHLLNHDIQLDMDIYEKEII